MTKKKIRYSEFAAPAPPLAPATPAAVEHPAPVAEQAPPTPPKARAPLDLARALAAARAAEAQSEGWAKTPPVPVAVVPPPVPLPRATVTMSLSVITPALGNQAIPKPGMRLTPARGLEAMSTPGMRLTPARGHEAIPTPGMRLTPARGLAIVPEVLVAPAPAAADAFKSLRERARARTGTVELLVFRMAQELFGIDLASVEEAIDLPPVRHVPEMPAAMLGVITVRGSLTSTYTPESALGLSLASQGSALIFKRGRGRVALVVDDVDDVHTLDLAELRDAPGSDADGILLGVIRRADGLLGLVDAEALIAACQAVPVLETA